MAHAVLGSFLLSASLALFACVVVAWWELIYLRKDWKFWQNNVLSNFLSILHFSWNFAWQPLCSLHIKWQQCQNSCSPILCVDVCYVFSCNAVWGLLPQTIAGSKCNGHVTNEEHVMLPSWSLPLLAFVSQASFPGSVMQINQLMTDKMAFLHRHACNKKGNAVSHVPIQRAL